MDTMLAGLDFTIAYMDDILIKSENNNEHSDHIIEVFRRIDDYSFNLSSEKYEFLMSQIKYLGQIINAKDQTPDPERAEAIKSMPVPNNVTKLQAILSLAHYYGIYIPNIQNLRAPLNNLLKKGVKWDWTKDCERDFQKIFFSKFRFIFSSFQPETRNCSCTGHKWLQNWCNNFA